jgi:type I restriction enzyme R subunit
MPITPEDRARENIDKLLTAAGWIVQDKKEANLTAGRGVAVREFPMKSGHGEADYLLRGQCAHRRSGSKKRGRYAHRR